MPRILQKIYLYHVKDIVNSYGFVNIDDCIQKKNMTTVEPRKSII